LRMQGLANLNLKDQDASNEPDNCNRSAPQPASPSQNGGHDGPRLRREDANRLHPPRLELHNLPRPLAGLGRGRGSARLPGSPALAGRTAADDERRGGCAAVLFHDDVRPAGDGQSSEAREAAAEATRAPDTGGGAAAPQGGTRAKV